MADILKGLAGGWSFLVSWVFPSAIAWTVFAFLDFPRLQHVPVFEQIGVTSPANQALALIGASIFTGLLLSSLSTVLFRLIEAYYLVPEPIAAWMRGRQQLRMQALRQQLQKLQQLRQERKVIFAPVDSPSRGTEIDGKETSAPGAVTRQANLQTGIDVRIGLIQERLRRYPADDRQFGPTQFANALRAIETYGWDRYRLDSQTLWSELISVVPDSLRTEEEAARAPVNFSVSMMYLSALLGIVCIAVGLSTAGSAIAAIAVGILSILSVPAWYRLAVLNTRYLSSVVQAVVNVGRVELAKKMGLSVPRKLQDERDMWERTFWFVQERFDEKYASDLNSYRLEEDKKGEP